MTYTQWEAWLAIHHGKRLVIAKPTREAPRGPRFVRDEAQIRRQGEHLRLLGHEANVHAEIEFSGIDNLGLEIAVSAILDLLVGKQWRTAAGPTEDQRRQIEAFMNEYRGLGGRPLPEIGRDAEITALTEWARDPASPALQVLAAPIGRGKSTLLVHLCDHLSRQDEVGTKRHLIFVPVSLRFGTHEPETYLRLLEVSLAAIAATPVEDDQTARQPAQIERSCGALVAKVSVLQTPTLIVIDGLDESLNEQVQLRWLHSRLGGNVKLLVSVRLQYGRETIEDWLKHWNWSAPHQETLLQPLGAAAGRAILRGLGAPESDLTSALMSRLMELSEGEPFLLSQYALDLWPASPAHQVPVTLNHIRDWSKGFEAYFKRLLAEQKMTWPKEDADSLENFLLILACARGRMSRGALEEVESRLGGAHARPILRDVASRLRRFIAGGWRRRSADMESGIVLAHPKFAEYFNRTHAKTPLLRAVREAYVGWGMAEVARLQQRSLLPEELDAYLPQWLHAHLSEAGAQPNSWAMLYGSWWRDAHLAHRGHLGYFVRDLDAASRELLRRRPAGWRGETLRCHLLRASALGAAEVPVELTVAAARCGLLEPDEAASALAMASKYRVWKGWLELARLPSVSEEDRRAWIDAAVAKVVDAFDSEQAIAYGTLSAHVPEAEREALLQRALHKLEGSRSLSTFYEEIRALTPVVDPDHRLGFMDAVVAQIRQPFGWESLIDLLPYAPPAEWEALIDRANAHRIFMRPYDDGYDPGQLDDFVAVVYRYMPAGEQTRWRDFALEAARKSQRTWCRTIGLAGTAVTSAGTERDALIDEMLAALADAEGADAIHLAGYCASQLEPEERRRVVASLLGRYKDPSDLVRLARFLDESDLDRMFDAVMDLPKRSDRAYRLRDIAPLLDREQVLKARDALTRFDDALDHQIELIALACDWPDMGKRRPDLALDEVLSRGMPIREAHVYTAICNRVSPHKQSEIVIRGLQWWLEQPEQVDSEGIDYRLATIWPSNITKEALGRIAAAARANRWPLDTLHAELLKAPLRPEVPAADDDDGGPPPPDWESYLAESAERYKEKERLALDSSEVRTWMNGVRDGNPDNSRLTNDDILDHLHAYPPALQRDCLDVLVLAAATAERDWLLKNIHRIAYWVHTYEGTDGVIALAEAVRNSAETFA